MNIEEMNETMTLLMNTVGCVFFVSLLILLVCGTFSFIVVLWYSLKSYIKSCKIDKNEKVHTCSSGKAFIGFR